MSRFHLFLDLPVDTQWCILDHLSLVDLWGFRLLSRATRDLCSEEYLQRRTLLFNADIDPSIKPGSQRYVVSIVKSGKIWSDPSIISYLSKSEEICFPGIERFIGLKQMALRAIKSNECLLHVMKSHPDTQTKTIIYSRLFSLKQNGDLFTSFEVYDELAKDDINNYPTFNTSIDHLYYPLNQLQWTNYQDGLNGRGSMSDYIIPYFIGLIDGKHEDLFIQEYESLVMTFSLTEMDLITKHAAAHGSVRMVNSLHIPKRCSIDTAIKSNNIEVAKDCLDEGTKGTEGIKLYLNTYPGSVKMLKLLRSYGVSVSDEMILMGAFTTGNYDLLSLVPKQDLETVVSAQNRSGIFSTPPYMLELISPATSFH